jgi:ATP-dependent Clp protease ATP-binding subunit ClpC
MAFEDFSEGALRAVVEAQDFGKELRVERLTSDLLLYGCIKLQSSTAAKILLKLGLTLAKVRDAILEARGGRSSAPVLDLKFAPDCARVVQKAVTEKGKRDKATDTIHLLLAIVNDEESSGAQLLKRLGIELDRVKKEAAALYQEEEKAAVSVGGASKPKKLSSRAVFGRLNKESGGWEAGPRCWPRGRNQRHYFRACPS